MSDLSSAAGLVGFLDEPDRDLQIFALQRLNEDIDYIWTEVAGSVAKIEALFEDETFPQRQLAALVAAKVYYQLQEYNESMTFALGAGDLLNLDHPGEFEDTIIAKCIDSYIALSVLHNPTAPSSTTHQQTPQLPALSTSQNGVSSTSAGLSSPTTPFSQSTLPSKSLLSRQDTTISESGAFGGNNAGGAGAATSPLGLQRNVQKSLQSVIKRLFERCYEHGAYRQVVGIAVEARNLEVLRETIVRASKDGDKKMKGQQGDSGEDLMEYVLDICMNVVQERGLRNEILKLILDLLNEIPNPDYFAIAKCVVYLDQHTLASNMLKHLVEREDAQALATAYQISFDLYDNGTQEFLAKVIADLPEVDKKDDQTPHMNGNALQPGQSNSESAHDQQHTDGQNHAEGSSATMVSRPKQTPLSEEAKKAYSSIGLILKGTKSIELNLEFLYRNNHADRPILNKIRDSLDARNSIFHTAVTFANAFMNSGTTGDTFFRENLEWLGKAVNWSKFTATAALGVIHRGNITQGRKLLEPYLPKREGMSGSLYSQGGSLYALGLIYSKHGSHVLDYLRDRFKDATDEVVQHGGALGLGVAGMATGDEEVFGVLREALWSDSAINGEAVGISMGLIMLGTGNIAALEEMIQYAHDTQHEKIVRGLAMGMALIMYGRQEAADELIQGLLDDPDPSLRYGGILTIALAYCGTGSNKAVRKLLHVAVSDVSDDVRRVAVMSLGFVLFRKPGSVPRMVELLAESYNPHVRYGAAMALGIACAGTGLAEAIDLLEPMMKDSTDFVRQGTLIALSMILVQQTDAMNPKVGQVRKQLQKIVSDRHEDAMAKFGCALALGIIDAGGRNCTIGLQTQTGNLNMAAVVGMAIFTQYWYWFPLTHFLSLSFTPTGIIGVDQDLEIPSFKFHSNTRQSMFDYPPEQEVKAEEAPEKVKTAVLSTTAQAKRRRLVKERAQRRESMDVDQTPTTPKLSNADADKMDTDEDAIKDDRKEASVPASDGRDGDKESTPSAEITRKKVEKEKVGYDLENMSRVLPAQIKYISFPDGRYAPVKKPTGGVILLTDKQPGEPKSLIELKVKKASTRNAPAIGGPVSTPAQRMPMFTEDYDSEMGGAAAGAGVLTAMDEDDEGGEEAPMPGEFDYQTDNEDGEDQD